MAKCIECKYFKGGGDFGTCCSKTYDLKYEYCDACDCFEEGVNQYVIYNPRGQKWLEENKVK